MKLGPGNYQCYTFHIETDNHAQDYILLVLNDLIIKFVRKMDFISMNVCVVLT